MPEEKQKEAGPRWGMVIDLDACTGCRACEVACAAENNLPVVGPEEMARGHDVRWLRVEQYVEGDYPDVRVRFMPVLCQQCEEAPCEPVCPVYATYHSHERGHLNVQVYNRCVGTRYCANNCPYRVRAFNWFEPRWPEPLEQQLNPDVSVREKGVMEKCTFCVQRIRRASDRAGAEGRPVRDGEVQPACVQACPAQAMVFGDLDDPGSRASRLAAQQRGFRLLEQLGTRPNVVYLRSGRGGTDD